MSKVLSARVGDRLKHLPAATNEELCVLANIVAAFESEVVDLTKEERDTIAIVLVYMMKQADKMIRQVMN